MDTRLQKALDLSSSLEMITNQRNQAVTKYKQNQILFYNGGTFLADLNFLSAIAALKTFSDIEHIVIDSNNIPIKINDIEEFYFLVQSKIVESSRQYYQDWEEIKKLRTPEALLKK
jgi:UDP-N-acetylglucosamine pyrophosphorylase